MSLTMAPTYEFTVEEYHKLNGVLFQEGDRVELLNGNIIVMSPIGARHAWAVRRLNNLFARRLGNRCLVDAQNALTLDKRSEPRPDILLIREEVETSGHHPYPEDIYLLVEVADSTLMFDRTDKRAAYARTGIAEYWILDLTRNELRVHREPVAGEYRSEMILQAKDVIAPLAFPDVAISVATLLPP